MFTKDPYVLSQVSGVSLEFQANPVQSKEPRVPKFNKKEMSNINLEVNKMLKQGVIEQTNPSEDQFVGHLFLRPKKSGGFRPVFNLKPLNRFIIYKHFKMETMRDLMNMIRPQDYMVKLDLKNAYFAVPIGEKFRKYLRFRWGGKLYQFLAMAFGLGPAPRIFTKILKPIVSFFRRLGIRLMIYLDDLIILNQDKNKLLQDLNTIIFVLQNLGFLINWEKSALTPTQVI